MLVNCGGASWGKRRRRKSGGDPIKLQNEPKFAAVIGESKAKPHRHAYVAGRAGEGEAVGWPRGRKWSADLFIWLNMNWSVENSAVLALEVM
jgi:hypothetical protein